METSIRCAKRKQFRRRKRHGVLQTTWTRSRLVEVHPSSLETAFGEITHSVGGGSVPTEQNPTSGAFRRHW